MNKKNVQLFIMPFAGGSASAFNELEGYLDSSVDVHIIEYPGRGSRISEPFCDTMEHLIEDAERQIGEKRNPELPFALMGYSMGVEVAFDLAQYVLKEKPLHLFFAAREAICYDTNGHDYSLLQMDLFIQKIVSLGGINEKILKNRRFLEMYMRPIYADYKLLHDYMYKSEKNNLTSNLTVFYSELDTPFLKVKEWEKLTTGITRFYEFGDNHFFINQFAKQMSVIINSTLKDVD